MIQYLLDRDVFFKAINGDGAREGDYLWSGHGYLTDNSGKRVFRCYHVPTDSSTFWIRDCMLEDQVVMVQVVSVPVLVNEWKIVGDSTGGSHA